jgi:uncharacterized protein YndB with AHSA1/START domain
MSGESVSEVVKKVIVVHVPVAFAFEVFTERMGQWWPETHHIGDTKFADILMDKRAGGRLYERNVNGKECPWGTILQWEPPRRVGFTWQLQPDWKFSEDLTKASEVEISFHEETAARTRVELVHRHLQRHGEGWEKLRIGVDSPGGWTAILERFAELANRG